MRIALSIALCALLSGCMTPEQRYYLHRQDMEKRYKQARTYQPFTVEAENGITLNGRTKFTVNVPLEQLSQTRIPDDLKTMGDLFKWGVGAGLIGYGIHEAGRADGDTTIHNHAQTQEVAP